MKPEHLQKCCHSARSRRWSRRIQHL